MTRSSDKVLEYMTLNIADQSFALPISDVHDVFTPEHITHVPLSSDVVAGVFNLRGRVVTAINMRRMLGYPDFHPGHEILAVGIEWGSEQVGLLIDDVSEILTLAASELEPAPANLDPAWIDLASGVFSLERDLLVVLDARKILSAAETPIAA